MHAMMGTGERVICGITVKGTINIDIQRVSHFDKCRSDISIFLFERC